MHDRNPIKKFYLGTAVKITALISIDTADSATITIDDASETEKVSSANMTKEMNKVYSYTYQSSVNDDEGDYVATITIVSGIYTSVQQAKFTMIEQE